ncbi:hypothetical protein ANN_21441 [Periplaneta americana]|uniref:Uncharacterized protein n=1 Tax=Periplaneta americana TaxID=6978 RepID=A0ABQ8SGJ8_PERAM|nr:hypothetical protein ANN_21441 [Periplaneta americana]
MSNGLNFARNITVTSIATAAKPTIVSAATIDIISGARLAYFILFKYHTIKSSTVRDLMISRLELNVCKFSELHHAELARPECSLAVCRKLTFVTFRNYVQIPSSVQIDNASAHAARTNMEKTPEFGGIQLLPYSAYSPDIAFSDYHLFQSIVHFLHGSNFQNLEAVPTHHTQESETLLDIIATTNPQLALTNAQLPAPGISAHDIIFLEYSLYCPKYKPHITSYRDLKHIEHDELINDTLSLPWTEVWNLPDIDDKIEKFNDLVIQLYDKHAPLKTRRVGRRPAPWMCDAIKLLMTDRDTAYRKYRRSKDELDFNTYKVLRNKCNQAVRNAKLRHAHSLILPSVSAKELWRNLNNLGLTKAKPRVDNINLSLNSLNEHFVTAPPEPLHKQETLEFLRSYPNLYGINSSLNTLTRLT